jgi:hypothetical protein
MHGGTYLRWQQWLVIKLKRQINKGVQYFQGSILDGFGNIKLHGNLLRISKIWLFMKTFPIR